jgi:hypothetical protein
VLAAYAKYLNYTSKPGVYCSRDSQAFPIDLKVEKLTPAAFDFNVYVVN